MLFDLSFTTKWKDVRKRKLQAVKDNNRRENSKRIRYSYRPGTKVLLDKGELTRKLVPDREGPYPVVKVYKNGTIKIRKGIVTQKVSIRRCVPFQE